MLIYTQYCLLNDESTLEDSAFIIRALITYDVDFLPKVAPKPGYLWIYTPELELVQKTSE